MREEEEPPPVDHVRDSGPQQHDQENRQRSGRQNHTHEEWRGIELRHQPSCADVLHPRARVGDDGGDPERAKERLAQRGERAYAWILLRGRDFVRCRHGLALRHCGELGEGPLSSAPSPDEIDDEAYGEQKGGISNFTNCVGALDQDKHETSDGEEGGDRKEPHAKWSRQLWPSNAEHDYADRLDQKLQQDANHDQCCNNICKAEETEQCSYAA